MEAISPGIAFSPGATMLMVAGRDLALLPNSVKLTPVNVSGLVIDADMRREEESAPRSEPHPGGSDQNISQYQPSNEEVLERGGSSTTYKT